MLTLEERIYDVEEHTNYLDATFGKFMAQTEMILRSMARESRQFRQESEQFRRESRQFRQESEQFRREQTKQWQQFQEKVEKDRQQFQEKVEKNRRQFQEKVEKNRQQFREEYEKKRAEEREEDKRERGKLARQLGHIANRQGRLVEDIITPSIRRLAHEELGCGELEFFVARAKRRHIATGRFREFDALYIGEKAVLLNESKAFAKPEYVKKFVEFLKSGEFFQYFPEYADKPIVPVFSSLDIPENVLIYLTRHKIYAVGMGDEAMDVLNREEIDSAT